MRVEVDLARCENHGQCVFAAPEVFAFDDDERLTFVPDPAAEVSDAVRSAAGACPVRAITLVED